MQKVKDFLSYLLFERIWQYALDTIQYNMGRSKHFTVYKPGTKQSKKDTKLFLSCWNKEKDKNLGFSFFE